MAKKDNQNKNLSRRIFLKHATVGVLGAAMGGVKWFDKADNRQSFSTIEQIAFGSCNNQNKPQTIWDTILTNNPDMFLFLGDNIYGDTEDMSVLKKKYEKLAAKPGYQKLKETCPVYATWDDHDYGQNDAGVEYSKKKESEQIFMDFFDIPEDSPRRKRSGIYGAYMFGPPEKRVQIILLDTRYFKDTCGRKRNNASAEKKKRKNIVGWYKPSNDTSATLLGEDQWKWLEEQLRKDADVRVVCSSIQFIAYEKGMESWGNYPYERKRLLNLIEKTGAEGVFIISGDVHFSELSRSEEGPYPIYDFTCSGMTHANMRWSEAVNNYRVGESQAVHNSGLIEIDWNQKDPTIEFRTIAVDGKVVLKHKIKKSELTL